jgi:hypothetical protein
MAESILGLYFSDGTALYEVEDAAGSMVILRNSKTDETSTIELANFKATMKLVRPLSEAA